MKTHTSLLHPDYDGDINSESCKIKEKNNYALNFFVSLVHVLPHNGPMRIGEAELALGPKVGRMVDIRD